MSVGSFGLCCGDCTPTPGRVAVEELNLGSVWRGMQPVWLPPYYGATPPGSLPWLPPVSWRQAYRKRWEDLEVAWTDDAYGGGSYDGHMYLIEPGQCPVMDGIPITIEHGDWSGPPTYGLPWFPFRFYTPAYHGSDLLFFWQEYAPVDDYSQWYLLFVGGFAGAHSFTADSLHLDWNPTGTENQTVDCTLTGEKTSADAILRVKTAIQARSWPTWVGNVGYLARFKDAGNGWPDPGGVWGVDPALNDGSVVELGMTDLGPTDRTVVYGDFGFPPNPYFGCSIDWVTDSPDPSSANYFTPRLWSGWIHLTTEENDSSWSTDTAASYCGAYRIGANIWGKRTRFMADPGHTYFLAQAIVMRPPRDWNPYAPGLPYQDLANVVVLSSGHVTTGFIEAEIPWPTAFLPGGTDFFAITQLGPPTQPQVLSVGAIIFAIMDETPAEWSARTGIPYV